MLEVMEAKDTGNLVEMFGSGTAAVVSPVGGLHYKVTNIILDTSYDFVYSFISLIIFFCFLQTIF